MMNFLKKIAPAVVLVTMLGSWRPHKPGSPP